MAAVTTVQRLLDNSDRTPFFGLFPIGLALCVVLLFFIRTDNRQKEPGKSTQAVPISRASAEHYVWGDKCDGWYLVKDSRLSVIEEQMPPGSSEVLHYHKESQQFFYVLSGRATMEVHSQKVQLTSGQGIRILPGTRHQISNSSSEMLRFLTISEPPSHADRFDVRDEKE